MHEGRIYAGGSCRSAAERAHPEWQLLMISPDLLPDGAFQHPTQAPYGFPPPQTAAYQYPPSLPQLHSGPSNQQSQFFPQLPASVSAHQAQQQQQQQQQRPSLAFPNGAPSIPSTPGNGPGAPPPDPESSGSNYEETLMNALQREAGSNAAPAGNLDDDGDDDDDDDLIDEDNPDEPVYQLPPPPEQVYPNDVELEKALHAWSLEHGYELVRRASKKNARKQLYKRYFHCSKHGKVAASKKTDSGTKVRVNRKSNRIGCPMSLAAVAVDPSDPSGDWQIRHRKTHHNHPAVDAIKLAGHRRRARTGGVEKAVDGLFSIGSSTGDVLKFLQRTNPEGLFNRTDVANMKLKYKKYGTCCQRGDEPSAEAKIAAAAIKTGVPSACLNCRSKKTRCDSARPTCGNCTKWKAACQYDHAPQPRPEIPTRNEPLPQPSPARVAPIVSQKANLTSIQNVTADTSQQNVEDSSMNIDSSTFDPSFVSLPSGTPARLPKNSRQFQDALAALANFKNEHIKATKLSLESSSVEILASTTCGNGDCYRSVVPRPFILGYDWKQFKENFSAAAVKENTYDVLVGDKKEPPRPDRPTADVTVDEHNEYIKQLAIFKRRNQMLKIGIKESLHPALWSQVSQMNHAHDMWNSLEDMCMPRGSDQAFTRFNDLLSITLPSCGSIDNYIHALESKHQEFSQMAYHHDTQRAPSLVNQGYAERQKRSHGGNGTMPEEMLCFIFLRGLGPQHQVLASNLCKKNNIGGYGSGARLVFKELTMLVKRAIEWEAGRAGRP